MTNDPLRCGDCACLTFNIAHIRGPSDVRFGGHGSEGVDGVLLVTCAGCGSKTRISHAPPRFIPDGHLCGGWQ